MTYIDPRGKVFAHLDRLADWRAGAKPAPVTLEWDLSNRCSLGCQSCHFAHTHSRGPWMLKPRTLPMAFESTGDLASTALVCRALGEVASAGVRGIVWSGGGEPTLHPDWRVIMHEAEVFGLQQGMYTLGGHLGIFEARELSHVAAWVVVSLDAVDAETYAREKGVAPPRFQAVCDGIVHLTGGEAVIGVSFLLHAGNWPRALEMLAFARQLGAHYATFRPVIDVQQDAPGQPSVSRAWVANALPTLRALAAERDVEIDVDRFQQYADWSGHGYSSCLGVRLNATVTPDGRVWLCPQRRGVAGSCLGDLRAESFGALWARHPGAYTVDAGCRVMCRLHPVNQTLAALEHPRAHEAFV